MVISTFSLLALPLSPIRDSYHLGIKNSFDHGRFIKFARVCDVDEKKGDEQKGDGQKVDGQEVDGQEGDRQEVDGLEVDRQKHICTRDKVLTLLHLLFDQLF